MKRLILGAGMVAAMLAMSSSAFAAAGVNLAWTACFGEATAVPNKTFACAANTGTNTLVCSFVLGADLAQVSGNELVLDILTTTSPLPLWWDLKNAGACRATAIGFNTTADANNVVCLDWAQGQSSGGIGAYSTELGTIDAGNSAAHRRIKIALAVPQSGIVDLLANTDYFACNVSINNTKSTGVGSCAGCSDPACVVLNSVNITTPVAANNVFLGSGTVAGSNIVTWQGPSPLNCQLVPTRNTTWGAVKSLYR